MACRSNQHSSSSLLLLVVVVVVLALSSVSKLYHNSSSTKTIIFIIFIIIYIYIVTLIWLQEHHLYISDLYWLPDMGQRAWLWVGFGYMQSCSWTKSLELIDMAREHAIVSTFTPPWMQPSSRSSCQQSMPAYSSSFIDGTVHLNHRVSHHQHSRVNININIHINIINRLLGHLVGSKYTMIQQPRIKVRRKDSWGV